MHLVVTGGKVLMHLTAGKDGPKGVKRLDRPEVIPSIVEPEPGLKCGRLIRNLA